MSDARYDQTFRKDFGPQIIAKNRHLASIGPVRLASSASGFAAGTVLAKNNVSGYFDAYNDGGSSGLNTAVCVLLDAVPTTESLSPLKPLSRAVFRGELFYDNLTGIDANGVTDLAGRAYTDSLGNKILSF